MKIEDATEETRFTQTMAREIVGSIERMIRQWRPDASDEDVVIWMGATAAGVVVYSSLFNERSSHIAARLIVEHAATQKWPGFEHIEVVGRN